MKYKYRNISLFHFLQLATLLFCSKFTNGIESMPSESRKFMATILPHRLNHKECWVLSKYFAHKTPDPIKSDIEVAKISGRVNDFDCEIAMKYWVTKLNELKKYTEDPNSLDKFLGQGLRFIRRKDILEDGNFPAVEFKSAESFTPDSSKMMKINEDIPTSPSSDLDDDDKLVIEDRVAKYDIDNGEEANNKEELQLSQSKTGIYTILLIVFIVVLAIFLLIATCLAFFRCKRCNGYGIDDDPSDETIPDVIASGYGTGGSGEAVHNKSDKLSNSSINFGRLNTESNGNYRYTIEANILEGIDNRTDNINRNFL